MTLYLDDGDVRLYHGDALETLRTLPDGSVDMIATSPPFYGLRDFDAGEEQKMRDLGMPVRCCDSWPECSHVLSWVEAEMARREARDDG